jgi:hypothetical protein
VLFIILKAAAFTFKAAAFMRIRCRHASVCST